MNSSVKEILYKLENDKANIEVKISEEKARRAEPLKYDEVKKFITMFIDKDYTDVYEMNEFFCRFIKKIIMFNDKMIIIHNGNFNPASEESIDNNEAFEKQILQKLKIRKPSQDSGCSCVPKKRIVQVTILGLKTINILNLLIVFSL